MKIFRKILSLIGVGGKKKAPNKDAPRGARRGGGSRNGSGSGAQNRRGRGSRGSADRRPRAAAPEREAPQAPAKRVPKDIPPAGDIETLRAEIPEFAELGLSAKTLSAVRDMGFSAPTEIQKKSIGVVLSGRDVIATAQTGTGKTAAFALPIIDMLGDGGGDVRVLVLSPTRELASQTNEAFEKFSKYADVKSALIQGGVSMAKQIEALRGGVDVVVATPGRLLDLLGQREIFLGNVKYLVLDEVDRMFDMGFIDDVSEIIRACPKQRQTLFFSATMPDAVLRLSSWALNNPEKIDVGIVHSPADTIEHCIYPVDAIQKYDLLVKLLETLKYDSLIVFTRTRIDADRIAQWLEGHNYSVSTLHSDRTQKERDKALQDFKTRKTSILVATDIASRGLDISGVGCVINYNVPEHSEDYVHRIGRTGRANTEGFAITLFSSEETSFLHKIETFINAKIERRKLEGFDYRTEPQLEEHVKKPRKRNR